MVPCVLYAYVLCIWGDMVIHHLYILLLNIICTWHFPGPLYLLHACEWIKIWEKVASQDQNWPAQGLQAGRYFIHCHQLGNNISSLVPKYGQSQFSQSNIRNKICRHSIYFTTTQLNKLSMTIKLEKLRINL
jgi:hypothetical protein